MPRLTKTKKKWVDIPNDPDNGRVRFKLLKPGEKRFLDTYGFEFEGFSKSGNFDDLNGIAKQDLEKSAMAYLDLCVIDWKNFFNETDGSEVPCNQHNKKAFFKELEIDTGDDVIGFDQWCRQEYLKFEKAEEEKKKAAEGN